MRHPELISMLKHGARFMMLLPLILSTIACRAVHAPDILAADNSSESTQLLAADTLKPTDSIWPARWGSIPQATGTIIELDPTQPLRPVHYSRYHQGRPTPDDFEDAAKLAQAVGIEQPFKFKSEGPGSFVFIQDPLNENPEKNPPDLAFKFVSAEQDPTASQQENTARPEHTEDHVLLQRTWFTFRDPKAGKDQLGTIVLLPGMFGTPELVVDAAERYWHHQGYAVLRMRSHPSRYTQHLALTYLDAQGEELAAQAASVADDRVAECAYATDAALDHVFNLRPELADMPVVLVGMSGGALALPSVYAFTPERYSAAVLIAGGANFLNIMIDSNYRDWIDAIIIDFDPLSDDLGKPDQSQIDSLSSLYLKHSRLDAYDTAPLLEHIPVLVLHASNDRAVPAATGDLLYQRLGKPERWTYPLGHELIFAALPTQIPRIDRWIKQQLPQSAIGAATDPAKSTPGE